MSGLCLDNRPKTNDPLAKRKQAIRRRIVFLIILGLLIPPATTDVTAQSTDDRVERILAAMSVEQRVGQVFMVDFLGSEIKPDSPIAQLIREYHIGAVYLTWLNGNVPDDPGAPTRVARLTNTLQQLACQDTRLPNVAECIPLLVAMDHEGDGWPRTHLRRDATAIPSTMAIGATWSQQDAQVVGEVVGRELAAVGVNLLLGPVVDVLESPHPEGRGDMNLRTFGGDPTWVGAMGRAYIRGVHAGSNGRVLTTAKHFPGHGSSDRNPDEEVSTVSKSLDELKRSDLVPFFAVTQASNDGGMTDALMPSHIRYRGFQGDVSQLTKPISLDPDGMKAFMSLPQLAAWRRDGLVVADALGVRAIQAYYDPTLVGFPARQIAKDALMAGNDLLPTVLYSLDRKYENQLANMQYTISYFRDEYRSNSTFRERLDDAVRHILRAKLKLYPDLSAQSSRVNVDEAASTVGKGDATMRAVIQDALTILRPEGGKRLPPPPGNIEDILILGCFYNCLPGATMSETAIEDTLVRLYGPQGSGQIDPARVHTVQFDQLDMLMAGELRTQQATELRKLIDEADWIVLGIVAYVPDAIPASAAFKRFLRDSSFDLRNKKLVAIAFNAPYYLDSTEIGKLTAYIVVYSKVQPAVEVAVRALFGELPSRGSPPVSVPGINYDLAAQLQPDPARRIPLNPPTGMTWLMGDSLTVQAGPLLDRNGRFVRDGMSVEFSARYSELGVALAPQVITPTQNGTASATFKLTLAGALELAAQSGEARSETVRLAMTAPASPAPATATNPAPAPTPLTRPDGEWNLALPWWSALIALTLIVIGALVARMRFALRRTRTAQDLDVTARGGPSVEQASGISLAPAERVILRQVFGKYSRVTVDAEFRSGYSGAHTLLVLPIKPDGRADAYAIAKLAPQWLIRQELANYEAFVKDTLPPVTARIEGTPTLPANESLGALRYTFVGQLGTARTVSLREFALTHPASQMAAVLEHKLFEVFGRNWWMQRRPFAFRLGQEYERLLPVNLIGEAALARPEVVLAAHAREWPDTRTLAVGQVIKLEGFIVEEISSDGRVITLTLPDAPSASQSSRRFRARVRAGKSHLPPVRMGEACSPMTASIVTTRALLLEAEARKAFDVRATDEFISLGDRRYPNPLSSYAALLDERVFGTLATIHGDLNLENILIDPGGYTWLIDFALTRDGHTLYDFARLETELVTRHIAPMLARAGLTTVEFVRVLEWLEGDADSPPTLGHAALDDAATVLSAVRRVANRCLFDLARPEEYARALLICQLGALKFANLDTVPEAPLPKQLALSSAAHLNRRT